VGQNLRDALEWLPKGRELITVKLDCDLSAHMASINESLVAREEDKEALLAFFGKYGFKTLLRELRRCCGRGSGRAAAAKPAPMRRLAVQPRPTATCSPSRSPPATKPC
jgi:DNA polymerase-1